MAASTNGNEAASSSRSSSSGGLLDQNENGPKAVLLNKIEGNPAYVNDVIILRGEDGVITVSDDK